MKPRRKTWREVFRQDEPALLRYLDRVAEAWIKRDRAGVVPLEYGGGQFPPPSRRP